LQPSLSRLFPPRLTNNGDISTHSLDVDINCNKDIPLPSKDIPDVHATTPPGVSPAKQREQPRQQQVKDLDPGLMLLWPRPQFLQPLGGADVALPAHLLLVVGAAAAGMAHRILDLFQLYREELATCGYSATVKVSVTSL
jgi:hypothetical protein